MAASAILKIRKIAISRPQFERFLQNLAWLRSSTLLTGPNVKNFKFGKSKMAAAAILKNRKITISRPQFKRFRRNLAHWCTSIFLTFSTIKNFKFWKSRWPRYLGHGQDCTRRAIFRLGIDTLIANILVYICYSNTCNEESADCLHSRE